MEVIKWLTALTIVAFVFDGCVHKDPGYYVDEDSEIAATSPSSPLWFQYTHPPNKRMGDEESHRFFAIVDIDLDEFRMGEQAYAGQCDNKYFLVNRETGSYEIYETSDEMETKLRDEFDLKLDDLKPLPWYSRYKDNQFYPYNYIYYMLAAFIIALSHSIHWYRKKNRLPSNKANPACTPDHASD
jgi:hypothetical protein